MKSSFSFTKAVVTTVAVLLSHTISHGFIAQPNFNHHHQLLHRLHSSSETTVGDGNDLAVVGVVAPLKYVGPYACLQLEFPNLNYESINFVLDTGANVNSISRDLANELDLPILVRKEELSVLGSAGAGGSFQAGDIVRLGNCQLGGMPENQQNLTFMKNLTAAALDLGIANSVCQGLLGTFFFMSFPAGVEFDWYGTDGDPPTMIFYYGKNLPHDAKNNTFSVPIKKSFFGVPSITININGVDLEAIIDTGSPITILSPSAAEKVKVGISSSSSQSSDYKDVKIKGIDDEIVGLSRSLGETLISIGNVSLENVETLCVGDLPGLSLALQNSNEGSSGPPHVLLGLDVLRRTYRMILRLPKEVLFEKLPNEHPLA